MEGGKEQNYWPGFVDALSNVVLTLVFVLVVFVFALVITSSKVEKKAKQLVEAAHQQATVKVQQQVPDTRLQEDLTKAKIEIEELKKTIEEKNVAAEQRQSFDFGEKSGLVAVGVVTITAEPGKITILYPKAITDLDEGSLANLGEILDKVKGNAAGKTFEIHSTIGLESYSAARRLAYYRILCIRNQIIQKLNVQGENIRSKIIQPQEVQNGRVEILYR